MELIACIKLPAVIANLQEFLKTASSVALSRGFSAERISEIELVIEEVFVNIANYAYEGGQGDVEMLIKADEAGNLHVEFIDEGVPFDSTSVAEPDLEADVEERNIGGLGIFFMKQLMADVCYSREADKNSLKFTVVPSA
ncbi:MAG: ATP-binding protein [Nitrospirae bacterium]|nr:ATP-binding protein [Nitrospirota bacterium]